MRCFTFFSYTKYLKSGAYSILTAHLRATGHILSMARGTALGSRSGGSKERPLAPPCGRCRNTVERASPARAGPQAGATELKVTFLRDARVSELKSPHARPSSHTSAFYRWED